MSTLGAMKARILSEMARPDLATQIAAAISDAIKIYQKERFRFSDVTPLAEPTFATVAGQWVYGAAANANIGTVFHIDYIFTTIGGTMTPLTQRTPAEIRMLNQGAGTQAGQPTDFAYEGNAILLYPTPSAAWTLTLGGHVLIAEPVADDTANNKWMTDAERLIRSRAKFEIATHVTRNPVMAAAMSPDQPGATWRAWRELKGEANKITGRGRVRAMQF